MPKAEDVYTNCDDLDHIPALMRENYLCESDLLAKLLPKGARVLQVGSMDGKRGRRLLRARPDLQLSGLEIEEELVNIARQKATQADLTINYTHGDITAPPPLPIYDYVICLNNTLGYIPDDAKALAGMKKLGTKIIVSVYGERFTDQLAKKYFGSLGLNIKSIEVDIFQMEDFTQIKRYSKTKLKSLFDEVKATPVGYFCILKL